MLRNTRKAANKEQLCFTPKDLLQVWDKIEHAKPIRFRFNNNNNNNNNNMFKQDNHFSYKNCYQYGSCIKINE